MYDFKLRVQPNVIVWIKHEDRSCKRIGAYAINRKRCTVLRIQTDLVWYILKVIVIY